MTIIAKIFHREIVDAVCGGHPLKQATDANGTLTTELCVPHSAGKEWV